MSVQTANSYISGCHYDTDLIAEIQGEYRKKQLINNVLQHLYKEVCDEYQIYKNRNIQTLEQYCAILTFSGSYKYLLIVYGKAYS